MKLVVAIFFISLSMGSLYFYQHPEKFEKVLMAGPEILKGKKVSDSDVTVNDDMSLPEIPKIKINPTEMALTPLKKEIKNLDEKKLGQSHYNYIHSVYNEVLDRHPTSEEEEQWLNTLLQGASRDAVYRGITLATDYLEKEHEENQKETTDVYQAFAIYYLKTYLGIKDINAEKLKKWGHLRISKYLVNQSLDLIDYFAANDLDALHRWYAVLSSDLASRFNIWNPQKEKMRILKSRKSHYKWAENVSNDFIKSEIIIKLHKVLNNL